MIYFIPAWYQQNSFSEKEQKWYSRKMHTEFDDTVKQIQLFHRNTDFEYMILLLSYTPNFRHFLHRQGVYHSPYWSAFDALQCITRKKATQLSFHNLMWPEHIEFVYTPFAVVAKLHGQKYAVIEFGLDGNPISIDMYNDEQVIRTNLYDDRGFVSSTIVYENGKPSYQDYLNEKGFWKFRHNLVDDSVEINPTENTYLISYFNYERTANLNKLHYDSMGQLIQEVTAAYVGLTPADDIFIYAAHRQHIMLLNDVLKNKKTIASFFGDRYPFDDKCKNELSTLSDANYVVADSEKNAALIRMLSPANKERLIDITPFDTRVDFGISQQLSVQNILVPVDGLGEMIFGEVIHYLAEYIMGNEHARVYLFTRNAEWGREDYIKQLTVKYLKQYGYDEGLVYNKDELIARKSVSENADVDADEDNEEVVNNDICVRFYVTTCVDELSVSKCMREQRVIVDMGEIPGLFLQITAISGGIPQIVRQETQYIEPGKNGMVIDSLTKLPEVLSYYLDGLMNWNKAVVEAYEKGKKYTTRILVDRWKEVIEQVGRD